MLFYDDDDCFVGNKLQVESLCTIIHSYCIDEQNDIPQISEDTAGALVVVRSEAYFIWTTGGKLRRLFSYVCVCTGTSFVGT